MSEKETSLVESTEEQTTQEESKTFDVNAFLGKGENEEVDTNTDDQPYTEAKKDEVLKPFITLPFSSRNISSLAITGALSL